jgi:preprotein translocase subunit SecG
MFVIPPVFADMAQYAFGSLMFFTAVFLILLVLVQRGRGGGLAGAFGGAGGQSAFGTKAGDLFTRITMGVAAFWILLCILSIAVMSTDRSVFGPSSGTASSVFETLDDSSTDGESSSLPSDETGVPSSLGETTSELVPADSVGAGAETGALSPADAGTEP